MRRTGLRLALAALLLVAAGPGRADEALSAPVVERFLAGLAGPWRGEAVVTPIGPRPYDIGFAWNDAGELAGAAEPGGATHHWVFRREGDRLLLRFLSTFRGNRRPTLLDAAALRDGGILFRAQEPAFLVLVVRVEGDEALIRVLQDERLHVEIRLRRP